MKKSSNVYWVEFQDSVYEGMDEFKKILTPTVKTADKSLNEFIGLYKEKIEARPVRLSDALYKESNNWRGAGWTTSLNLSVLAKDIAYEVLRDETLTDETKADITKAWNEVKNLICYLTNWNSFTIPTLPHMDMNATCITKDDRYGGIPDKILQVNLSFQDLVVKGIKVNDIKDVCSMNKDAKDIYNKIHKAIDVDLPDHNGRTRKEENDFRALLEELRAEAIRVGKIKDDEEKNRWRWYGVDYIRECLDPIVQIGSMSAVNDIYRVLGSYSKLGLEVRKRFRVELAQFLITLGHPLYSLEATVNIPSSVINKKLKEAIQ